jgi:hypothetical protein
MNSFWKDICHIFAAECPNADSFLFIREGAINYLEYNCCLNRSLTALHSRIDTKQFGDKQIFLNLQFPSIQKKGLTAVCLAQIPVDDVNNPRLDIVDNIKYNKTRNK